MRPRLRVCGDRYEGHLVGFSNEGNVDCGRSRRGFDPDSLAVDKPFGGVDGDVGTDACGRRQVRARVCGRCGASRKALDDDGIGTRITNVQPRPEIRTLECSVQGEERVKRLPAICRCNCELFHRLGADRFDVSIEFRTKDRSPFGFQTIHAQMGIRACIACRDIEVVDRFPDLRISPVP